MCRTTSRSFGEEPERSPGEIPEIRRREISSLLSELSVSVDRLVTAMDATINQVELFLAAEVARQKLLKLKLLKLRRELEMRQLNIVRKQLNKVRKERKQLLKEIRQLNRAKMQRRLIIRNIRQQNKPSNQLNELENGNAS